MDVSSVETSELITRPTGRSMSLRKKRYPVILPSLSDSRLHLAVIVISIQVLGQVSLKFPLSIAQILISVGTCAFIELSVTFQRERVIAWPASAMLTGNGIAIILRSQGTEHGDWWSTEGWYFFAGTALAAMLTKYLVRNERGHVFNPANVALVPAFLLLGSDLVEPQDLWWGPLDRGLALTLVIIAIGALIIVSRTNMAAMSLGFWTTFALGIGALTVSGQYMDARWHLGPVTGFDYWWILVTSPEILVFQFFMITDPKTSPTSIRHRLLQGVAIGTVATVLVAPQTTEYATKVAILASLTVVSFLRYLLTRNSRVSRIAGRTPALAAGVVCALVWATVASMATHPDLPKPPGGIDRSTSLPTLPTPEISTLTQSITPPVDQALAAELLSQLAADLELAARAGSTDDPTLLQGAFIGDLLVEAASTEADGATLMSAYRIDSARIELLPRPSPQAPPTLGVHVEGTSTATDGTVTVLAGTYAMSQVGEAWLASQFIRDEDHGSSISGN